MPTYTGSPGNDVLTGSSSNDIMDGLAGNDWLNGVGGNDSLIGGTGDDQLNGGDGNDTLIGGDGNDDVFAEANADSVSGGTGDDTLYGNDGNDTILGGDGYDILLGGTGTNILDGGPGVDAVSYVDSPVPIVLDLTNPTSPATGAGQDTLTSIEYFYATNFADTIYGSSGNDLILGMSGNDVFHLENGGYDTIFGDGVTDDFSIAGTDTYYLGSSLGAYDRIEGKSPTSAVESDVLVLDGDYSAGLNTTGLTIKGANQLVVRPGHDYVMNLDGHFFVGPTTITIDASALTAGDDLTYTGPGTIFNGGAGNDTITFVGGFGKTFNLASGGNDIVNGSPTPDTYNFGGALNAGDFVDGGGDAFNFVNLNGDYGAGTTLNGKNISTVNLAAGHDYKLTLGPLLAPMGGNVTINANLLSGGNFVAIDASALTTGGIYVRSTQGDDTIIGSSGIDDIKTGAGNDSIYAGGGIFDDVDAGDGDDYLNGGDGIDRLNGGAGNDTLIGGAGDDELWGFEGTDGFTGGTGNDLFIIGPTVWLTNTEVISDAAIGDSIFIEFPYGPPFIGMAPFTGVVNEVDYVWGANSTTIQIDVDGNGTADKFVRLDGGHFTLQGIVFGSLTLNVVASDTTPPTLLTSSPTDNAGNVSVNANVLLHFNDVVVAGSGNVEFRRYSDGTLIKSIQVTDASQVSFSGSNVTINPTTDLAAGTGYYVLLAPGVIKDAAGNAYAGIQGSSVLNFTTSPPPDVTGPFLASTTPPDDALSVAANSYIVLKFNEAVKAGSGNIEIRRTSDGSLFQSIGVADVVQVDITGGTVTINPLADFENNTGYYVLLAPGVIQDSAGNAFAGISSSSVLNFTTAGAAAASPPLLSSTYPADNASNLSGPLSLVFNFSEPVKAGTGNIELHRTSDDSLFESIPITNVSRVHFLVNAVTVDPIGVPSLGLYVIIGNGVIQDLDGNNFAGISSPTAFNFSTSDSSPPTLTNASPGSFSMNVPVDTNIVLTFNEPIAHGAGDIELFGPASHLYIPVNDSAQASFAGNTLTINPSNNFLFDAVYQVIIAPGVIRDLAGNDFDGVPYYANLYFQTALAPDVAAPLLSSSSPADNAGNALPNSNVVLTFNEKVQLGTGYVEIRHSDGTLFQRTLASDLSISDNTVTIHPSVNFTAGESYYVTLTPGAIEDLSGNDFAGISSATTLNFGVAAPPDTIAPELFKSIPYDNSGGIAVHREITLQFLENIKAGSGNLEIRRSFDDTLFAAIPVTDAAQVHFHGVFVDITPTSPLEYDTGYYIEMAPGVVKDLAGNSFAGITNRTDLNFATEPWSTTIVVWRDFTLASGQTLNIIADGVYNPGVGFLLGNDDHYSQSAGPSFINHGHITVSSPFDGDWIIGFGSREDSTYPTQIFENDGVIEVTANSTSTATGIFVNAWFPHVINATTGQIIVQGGDAEGINRESSALENAGLIQATATNVATGFIGGSITNSGIISVHGDNGSTGLVIAPTGGSVINSGTIVATSGPPPPPPGTIVPPGPPPPPSIGIDLAYPSFTPETIWNSGNITATIAINEQSDGNSPSSHNTLVYNSGTISGSIALNVGVDILTNSGTISGLGTVDLGAGNDVYDGRLGTSGEAVHGGTNDDVLLAGINGSALYGDAGNDYLGGNTGIDNLFGGDGNDMIFGGAGADNMAGGNGSDTFVFAAVSDLINTDVGSSRVDLQACKLEYSIVSPK